MKIRILTVILCSMLLLGGCRAAAGDNKAAANIAETTAQPFTFSGMVTLAELEQSVGVTVTKNADSLVLVLNTPEPVAGLRLEFDEEITRVSYRELVMNLSEGDIPQQSFFVVLKNALAALPLADPNVTHTSDGVTVQLSSGLARCTMLWNNDGTMLKRIDLPEAGAVFKVESFNKIL